MPLPLTIIIISIIAYLLGSIPVAYLIPKHLAGIDIRAAGSRNPGALNVWRSVGKAPGLAVFLLDVAKGLLAIYFVQWLDAPDAAMYLAAILVAVGHNWSPFMKFGGGKGVATVFGVSLAVLPWLTLIVLGFTLTAVVATRYIVPSFAAGFILLNVLTVLTSQPGGQIALCIFLTLVVAGTHFGRMSIPALSLAQQGRWRDLARME